MKRLYTTISLLTLFVLGSMVSGGAYAQANERCFPATGQCITGRIRQFWEQNGGLSVFGYPITPQQEEIVQGMPFQAQWFERNRMELHPENAPPYDVLLGRLGAERMPQTQPDPAALKPDTPQDGCRFFTETSQNVCGMFLAAWHAHGLELDGQTDISETESLALWGVPLSAPYTAILEGKPYTVQYFERARFELHPENAPPYLVLFGLLGREIRESPPPPNPESRKITLTAQDLEQLTKALGNYNLKPEDVNTARSVTFALPGIALASGRNSVIVISAPLVAPPEQFQGAVGVFKAERLLPLPDQPPLVEGMYLVVQHDDGNTEIVSGDGDRHAIVKSERREMTSEVAPPEATITLEDLAYSWGKNQIILPISPRSAIEDAERQSLIESIRESVDRLAAKSIVSSNEVNLDGATPDVAGRAAVARREASVILAPPSTFIPRDDRGFPLDNSLIAVVRVVLPIDMPNRPIIQPGIYALRASRPTTEQFRGRLLGDDGSVVDIPLVLVEARRKLEKPMIILLDALSENICIPYFENCPARSP